MAYSKVTQFLVGRRQMMGGWMYGYGSFHWFWFIVMVALVAYPVGRILNRIGFSPLWAIAMFIPLVNLIALWILAFTEWPRGRGDKARNPSPPI